MKRVVVFLAVMLIAVSASAQKSSVTETGLSYSHKIFYLDGQAVPSSQLMNVLGDDLYQSYRKGKGLRTAGIVCTSVGGVFLAGGIIGIASAAGSDSAGGVLSGGIVGTYSAIAGGVVLIPGIIMLCSGNSRIKKIPVTYNARNHSVAYLTPASAGVGVALRF